MAHFKSIAALEEFLERHLFTSFAVDIDNDGQVIIYTGMFRSKKDENVGEDILLDEPEVDLDENDGGDGFGNDMEGIIGGALGEGATQNDFRLLVDVLNTEWGVSEKIYNRAFEILKNKPGGEVMAAFLSGYVEATDGYFYIPEMNEIKWVEFWQEARRVLYGQ